MQTPRERQDYLWRPNDNSSTTRLRYDLEAEHWYKSFKSAERKHKTSSIREDLSVIGIVLQLVFSLLWIVFLLIKKTFYWLKTI